MRLRECGGQKRGSEGAESLSKVGDDAVLIYLILPGPGGAAYSGGGGGEKGKLVQIVRKCNEYRV